MVWKVVPSGGSRALLINQASINAQGVGLVPLSAITEADIGIRATLMVDAEKKTIAIRKPMDGELWTVTHWSPNKALAGKKASRFFPLRSALAAIGFRVPNLPVGRHPLKVEKNMIVIGPIKATGKTK